MDSVLNANWTAAQVMKAYPQVASVFLELKTDCVGCHLDKFCTLSEVAAAYELPLEQLLHQLREAIQNSTM
jgi:hybrid cluster-associated redox disulfide protein